MRQEIRFVITNSVPANGGDEAMLRAMVQGLMERWPNSDIKVLCSNVQMARTLLPDLQLYTDLEFASAPPQSRLLKKILWSWKKVQSLNGITRRLCARVDLRVAGSGKARVLDLYREADIILSSPGGFLHDYYPIEERLFGFQSALILGKPVLLFPQSIGPFWKPRSIRSIRDVLNQVRHIFVREAISKKNLIECGVDPRLITESADICFTWRGLAPELFVPKGGKVKSIGLCFRQWPLGDDSLGIINKATVLCEHLLEKKGIELHFVSTCQGVPGYVDDSTVADIVVKNLKKNHRTRCNIVRDRYGPLQLITVLSNLDLVVSMRLHLALLAMLGGTPAAGLAYEMKTVGIFEKLQFAEYQVDHRSESSEWIRCAERLIADIDAVRGLLPNALDKACRKAQICFQETARVVEEVNK